MEQGNNKNDDLFSKKVRAGSRRTYFFDVRTTKSEDFYVTITESKRKFDDDGYDRHKLHLYKEDFNKFIAAMNETIDHVKTELMPEFDYAQFDHKDEDVRPSVKSTPSVESTPSDESKPDDEATPSEELKPDDEAKPSEDSSDEEDWV